MTALEENNHEETEESEFGIKIVVQAVTLPARRVKKPFETADPGSHNDWHIGLWYRRKGPIQINTEWFTPYIEYRS